MNINDLLLKGAPQKVSNDYNSSTPPKTIEIIEEKSTEFKFNTEPKGFESCGQINKIEIETIESKKIDNEDKDDNENTLNLSSLSKNCTYFLNHELKRFKLKKGQYYINKFKEFNENNKRKNQYNKFDILPNTCQKNILEFDIILNIENEIISTKFKEDIYIDNKTLLVNDYQLKNILLIIREFDIDNIVIIDENMKKYNINDEKIQDNCNIFWGSVINHEKNILKCFDECNNCLYKEVCEYNNNNIQYQSL